MKQLFQNEDRFITWLTKHNRGSIKGMVLGIGDDAGLIRPSPGHEIVLTTDLIIENVHFSRHTHPPKSIGHRALARGLSDVAAMGGKPKFFLISLALSEEVDRAWVKQFYAGVLRLARRFGVAILGGDTAITPHGVIADIIVVGEVERGRALLRSGAQPGHIIYVAGTLGLSALGLDLLQSGLKARYPAAAKMHLYPEPQCGLGQFLTKKRLASAAMDISDGLSMDLGRLLKASRVGARIWEDRIPKPPLAGTTNGANALSLALNGGEDYRLLFTVPPSKVTHLPSSFEGCTLYQIGEVCAASQGVSIVGPNGPRPLIPEGYDHFRRGKRKPKARM